MSLKNITNTKSIHTKSLKKIIISSIVFCSFITVISWLLLWALIPFWAYSVTHSSFLGLVWPWLVALSFSLIATLIRLILQLTTYFDEKETSSIATGELKSSKDLTKVYKSNKF